MVDSMKHILLLKPIVLTPNRNGFMAKKCKWHLKAGSTVHVHAFFYFCYHYCLDNVTHWTQHDTNTNLDFRVRDVDEWKKILTKTLQNVETEINTVS